MGQGGRGYFFDFGVLKKYFLILKQFYFERMQAKREWETV
jgi:hypothetical protein